jgi:membrane-bound lytic murein transglycosylase B
MRSLTNRCRRIGRARLLAVLVSASLAGFAAAAEFRAALRPEIEAFAQQMTEKYGMGGAEVRAILRQARIQRDILRAMSAQYTAVPWHRYRLSYVNADRIQQGVQFWNAHAESLARAEREFGVPAEVVVATIGVETIYGGYTGKHRVLDALTTLAFDFPRRAEFFRSELEEFLLLARDGIVDPFEIKGSYAGAIGIPQFLPSSYRNYAVDFDGDGRANLWDDVDDAIGSVANYYSSFGWQPGRPVAVAAKVEGDGYAVLAEQGIEPRIGADELRRAGVTPLAEIGSDPVAMLVLEGEGGTEYWLGLNNFYMITRYNRSTNYAMSVYQLAQEIRAARATLER